jgi:ribosomal protein S27AE
MWKPKACPRCGGDVFIDPGLDTWYEQCLQCGYQRELADIRQFEAQRKRAKEPVLAREVKPSKK